jgi:hypothetical protein
MMLEKHWQAPKKKNQSTISQNIGRHQKKQKRQKTQKKQKKSKKSKDSQSMGVQNPE